MTAHLATGHGGFNKTSSQIQNCYYWESMSTDIHKVVHCCNVCQKNQPFSKSHSHCLIKPKFAFHTVSIDVVGPLATCTGGFKYLIVAIDDLTKWVKAKPISSLTAKTAAQFILDNIICRHGCPQFIKTDNGTNFKANIIPLLNAMMGSKSIFTAPYHPESNGTVEQVNGTLVNILRKLALNHQPNWHLLVSSIVFAYNLSTHSSTRFSPFELLYGRKPALSPILYQLVSTESEVSYSQYLTSLVRLLIHLQTQAFSSSYNMKTVNYN